jgi:hypothetical protein
MVSRKNAGFKKFTAVDKHTLLRMTPAWDYWCLQVSCSDPQQASEQTGIPQLAAVSSTSHMGSFCLQEKFGLISSDDAALVHGCDRAHGWATGQCIRSGQTAVQNPLSTWPATLSLHYSIP